MRYAGVMLAANLLLAVILGVVIWLAQIIGPGFIQGPQLLYITRPQTTEGARLYIHDMNSGLRHAIADNLGWGSEAAWSPDGRYIAYSAFFTDPIARDILLFDLDTNSTRPITSAAGDYNSPAWSPDGQYLAYHGRVVPGGWSIYLHNRATGTTDTVHSGAGFESRPAWSPDGERLAFETNVSSMMYADIVIMTLSTGQVETFSPGTGFNIAPDWSPDGERLVFATLAGGGYDLYTARVDGTDARNLTQAIGSELNPAWSPDGRYIAFEAGLPVDDYHTHIYLTKADGTGSLQRLTDGTEGFSQPSWRP